MGKKPKSSAKKKPDSLLDPVDETTELTVKLRIPNKVMRVLDLEGKWAGSLKVEIQGRTSSRVDKLRRLYQDAERRKSYRIDPELRKLIDTWNRGADPPPYRPGQRNRPFDVGKLPKCEGEFRQLLRLYGQEQVLDLMSVYFEARKRGDAYWDGFDHGYKTLSGWTKALLLSHKESRSLWWEPSPDSRAYDAEKDQYAELTEMVADSYAQIILNRSEYGDVDGNWVKFQQTGCRVAKVLQQAGGQKVSATVFVKMLVRCAQKEGEQSGRTVYPGTLHSDMLWKVQLPQFLGRNLPGFEMGGDG